MVNFSTFQPIKNRDSIAPQEKSSRKGPAVFGWPGLFAPGLSPPRAQKKPEPTTTQNLCASHWLRLSKHWPWSISNMISFLQSRHQTARFTARVLGSIRISRLLRRQMGQTRNPSRTAYSLPRFGDVCNAAPISSITPFHMLYMVPSQIKKNRYGIFDAPDGCAAALAGPAAGTPDRKSCPIHF